MKMEKKWDRIQSGKNVFEDFESSKDKIQPLAVIIQVSLKFLTISDQKRTKTVQKGFQL